MINEAPMETTQLLSHNVTFICTATGIPLLIITLSSDNDDVIVPSNATVLNYNAIFLKYLSENIVLYIIKYSCLLSCLLCYLLLYLLDLW